MAVIRVNKTADYTVMSNAHFKEKELSLKAKGLLSLMLSLPDNWDYSIAGLVTLSADGKDRVMSALNELEALGYLKRTKLTDEKGRFAGYDYDIYENPQTENPYAENPNTDKPNTENPPQLNTNTSNTKETNTNSIKYIVDYLNSKTGSKFRHNNKTTARHISARLKEGYTIDDFITVIDKKCADWLNDEKMSEYLRPSTLFAGKFEEYLNSKRKGTVKPPTAETNTFKTEVFEL